MRIIFSHNNFPAQFRRLAPALAEQGHEIVFLAQNREWHAPPSAGIRLKEYTTIAKAVERLSIPTCVASSLVSYTVKLFIALASN